MQEGKAAGVEWRNSVGKLRDLGQRKLKLQEDIDSAKANLKALLNKMQDLQQSILEAQAEVNKATQEYETKVLTQCAEEAHHGVESVLQALGIQEDALTEAQQRSLAALKKDTADEAPQRLSNSTFRPAWLHSSALNLRLLRSPGLPRVLRGPWTSRPRRAAGRLSGPAIKVRSFRAVPWLRVLSSSSFSE